MLMELLFDREACFFKDSLRIDAIAVIAAEWRNRRRRAPASYPIDICGNSVNEFEQRTLQAAR